MKNFLWFALITLVTLWCCICIYPNANFYPFGYPVEQGDLWEMTFVSDEGTPIERWDTMTVRVDSTYQGYVIGATTKDGQTYTHGMTMRCFVGAWPFHYPTTAKLIERK